ncbi:PREDICTED: uncharacterized protein LOC109210394 isoform X1 [Nicotiana attenuata]|uniref:uncharacterized protein LOC109210394 isoform X1 n=1 Tax=Nicotiana attenuata TaxID=49451 RepID=UPI0009051FFC|nr:PREDICTED: uncharacterized protein LOC109210394 isoform X1 [Nicotiana attenuata]
MQNGKQTIQQEALGALASLAQSAKACNSSVDPAAFLAAIESGTVRVEIGNYDSFYDVRLVFHLEQLSRIIFYNEYNYNVLLTKIVDHPTLPRPHIPPGCCCCC